MKQQLLLVAFLLSGLIASAQTKSEEKSSLNHEISIDATYFIKNLIDLSANYYSADPHFLRYKLHTRAGSLRLGGSIGGSNRNIEDSTQIPQLASNFNTESSSAYAFLGWEFKTPLSKRFILNYGLDYRFAHQKSYNKSMYGSISSSYYGEWEETNTGHGAAAVLGIKFLLTQRFFLYAETSWIYMVSNYNRNRTYTPVQEGVNTPEDILESYSEVDYGFQLPVNLYVGFSF